MAKTITRYVCQSCGAVHRRWAGKCDACGAWNSIVEEVEADGGAASMIMLGNAVFATAAFAGAKETRLTRHRARALA